MKTKTIIIIIIFILLFIGMTLFNKNGKTSISNPALPEMMLLDPTVPNIPVPVTNNAVASIKRNGITEIFSFFGLGANKTHVDISRSAYRLQLIRGGFKGSEWKRISDVPVPQGRLASIAVSVKDEVYLFGGYSVAEDHSEISQPEVFRFSPTTLEYTRLADMPTPVDDAVAYAYKDRYVYIVSGWHDKDNVNLVQVYDTDTDEWSQATAFPGPAVFGHSGGLVDNSMLVCDGVTLYVDENEKRNFNMSPECYRGDINENNVQEIVWIKTEDHPLPPRYRMASVGDKTTKKVYFLGGTENPYNFDGIGYNKVPSTPAKTAFAFDFQTNAWEKYAPFETASMDHRGLLIVNGVFVIVGGMDGQQNVLDKVSLYSFPFADDE